MSKNYFTQHKNIIIAVFLGLILYLVYFTNLIGSYRMPASYNYDSDLGRDLLVMEKITQGKLTLVGPQFSFAGLRLSPYHFYLFAPFLAITNADYRYIFYANAIFFIIGFIILLFFLKKKFTDGYTYLSLIWLASSSYLVFSARSVGNAFSYLIFLLIYIFYVFYTKSLSFKKSVILGFTAGIFINYHPISLLSAILPFIFLITTYKEKLKNKLINSLIYFSGLFVSFLPVLAFDFKHQFVITKSIFSEKATEFGGWAPHYSFPFFILLQVILIVSIAKFRYANLVLIFLIIINIAYFPFKLYQPARSLYKIENNFDTALKKLDIPKNSLNVILINETYLSAVGYEYRFLLTKKGYKLDDEYSYQNSQYLLIISEKGKDALKDFKSWELEQFGKKRLIKNYNKDNLSVNFYEKF